MKVTRFLWNKFIKPVGKATISSKTFLASIAARAVSGRWDGVGTEIASKAINAVFPEESGGVVGAPLTEEEAKFIAAVTTKEILLSPRFAEYARIPSWQAESLLRAYLMILQPEFADTPEEIEKLIVAGGEYTW